MSHPRRYDATRRQRTALERRAHVIDTATVLFAEHGFEATTLADVASAAGVSLAYLHKLGSKSDLIESVVRAMMTGDTAADPDSELDALVHAATMEEYLDLSLASIIAWNARSHRLWMAWASASDPGLRAGWNAVMTEVRAKLTASLALLDARGWLRGDVPHDELVATLWVLTMAETYTRLVDGAGLSHDDYVRWLHRSVREALLPRASQPA
ncbi:TetR/AcrR family transcriptional regulator [Microbacterium lacus]|uniref:HTH tetR-type domain-containing protein n=1 Tax=Microbacterium lacus TaxID=415217 RepID=A0ABN2H8L6_9MICO